MDNADERWLSRRELAERYGLPVKTLRQWASKGDRPTLCPDGPSCPIPSQRRNRLGNRAVRREPIRPRRRWHTNEPRPPTGGGHGVPTSESWRNGGPVMIPIIYDLAEAARILGLSESYLRSKLRDRTYAGLKRAGRWAMTEAQIEAAIESMCIDARPADPPSPSGLSKHSRLGRRLREQRSA
jgi:AraC-like DNA-binding protein